MKNVEGIELRKFITLALVDIVKAVEDAQNQTKTGGQKKSPIGATFGKSVTKANSFTTSTTTGIVENDIIKEIEFDIAVTVSKTSGAKTNVEGEVKGEIYVLSAEVELNRQGHREQTDSFVSRIKFVVPVFFEGGTMINVDEKTVTRPSR